MLNGLSGLNRSEMKGRFQLPAKPSWRAIDVPTSTNVRPSDQVARQIRNSRADVLHSWGILCIPSARPMTWKAPFDEAIRLANGKALRTLRDAADHVVSLPPRETKQRHWQTAIACLLSAAEKSAPLMMAHIAIKRALGSGKASPSERLRRLAKRPTILR